MVKGETLYLDTFRTDTSRHHPGIQPHPGGHVCKPVARVNCGRIMMATSLLLASATLGSWLVGHTWPLAGLMCPAQAKVSCVPLVIQCPHLTTPHVFHQCTCASGVSISLDQLRCPGKRWHSVILKLPLIRRLSCCDSCHSPPMSKPYKQLSRRTEEVCEIRKG